MRPAALLAGGLALAFVGYSLLVASGAERVMDRQVAIAFAAIYHPSLLTTFRALALLGGLEGSLLLAALLFAYLWRRGHRLGAWAAAAVPLASLAELVERLVIFQPSPPEGMAHLDGPSLTDLFAGAPGSGWSFPSGHMTRAVVIYGLLAFVAGRLATRRWVRWAAPLAAALLLVAMAFDRLYLAVHWESDVIGGLLLGGSFLAAAVSWLEWSGER